jgi:AcrR family transcriptional regulator
MLEAAQALLVEGGPAAVNLDDVAAAVGVTRQAVLHHFESRAGLLRAVVARTWTALFAELASLDPSAEPAALVDRLDTIARRRGHARLGGWLLLSEEGLPDDVVARALAELPGKLDPEDPDAANRLLLVGAALFGDAVFGGRLRQVFGLPDGEEARAAFRAFLVERAFDAGS